MTGTVDKNAFRWRGEPVECYNSSLKKGDYKFYKSCVINSEVYFLGDFAICKYKGKSKRRICRLMTLYESNEPWHQDARNKAIVRWYTWARDLESRCNPEQIRFDCNNEVIEDYRGIDVFISLENVMKKCRIVFATEEDPMDLIIREKLNPDLYFSCRYKIVADAIEPIFASDTDWGENEVFTTLSVNKSSLATLSDLKSPLKRKTPTKNEENTTAKHQKLISKANTSTPNQKQSVKRNLNDSFADIPDSQNNTPVLNYSIVSPDIQEDDAFKLKLRLSQKKNPKVIVEKLKDDVLASLLSESASEADEAVAETPRSLRRSCRAVQRKSYAELISPEKFTPKKRTRRSSRSVSVEEEIPVPSEPKRSTRQSRSCKEYQQETNTAAIKTSKRTIKTPQRYADNVLENTSPRKSILKTTRDCSTPSKRVTVSEDYIPETPKKKGQVYVHESPKRNSKIPTPKRTKKLTPSARSKQIREGILTPSVQKREKAVQKGDTPLIKARSQLHVSHVPDALPCREREYCDVFNFLEGKLQDGCGGCMYVSGVPGTGKTATVTAVIRSLQDMSKERQVPQFDFVNLNGMRITEPRQAYVEILKQLTGKSVVWEQAQSMLDTRFSKSKKSAKPVIMLVDELDVLCTKRQDVVYNLLDWPTKANAQLIVVTIANTMDLPERLLMGRVTSRLGLTRLTFQPYSYKQLQEIVLKRLEGLNTFNPDAVQLVARKVASVSGDARRALDICRRAAEYAETEGAYTLVSMVHVNSALEAMITQPKVQAIKHCSRLEQLILQAVTSEIERTGVEETTFTDVYTMFASLARLDGFKVVSRTRVLAAVNRLGACRLLLTDQKCSDMYQRIILNVSADDVYYALRKD